MADTGPGAHGALLVSVIIPGYNHGTYIGATLASVLAQHDPHVEAIVVDDGSTDDTAQRLTEFQGRVVYRQHASRGMVAAHNQGIALALGLLAYQKPDTRAARKHFGRPMALQPKLRHDRGLMSCYIKTLLGARLLAAVRRTRHRRPGARQVPEQPEQTDL